MFKNIVEINEDQPNDKQRLFNQSLGEQGSEPPLLAFGRNSKACRGVRKLYSGKKGRLQICPDCKLLAWGSFRSTRRGTSYVTG